MKKQTKKQTKQPRSLSFGNLAQDYQKYRKTYNAALYKKLFALIASRKEKKGEKTDILDIGCGTGKSTIGLIASAPRKMKSTSPGGSSLTVIGIDPDPKMLDEARAYAETHQLPITYMQGTAEKLPFKKERFDAVISGTAFHWFATKKTFTKIRNTLKPGGVCMVFWTWKRKGQNEGREAEAELLKKYDWKSISAKWRDIENIRQL
ncbi:class I SAM-dependent methyltransferase, partial [bacterium]|nr:class I SAM-dependent methyltransferase [bacterium]